MFGIGMGPSKGEESQYGALTSGSGSLRHLGKATCRPVAPLCAAYSPATRAKISAILAPQINSLKTSVQQDQKTNAMNNNRGGGTNASTAAAADKAHADITNLTGNLTGQAASTLGSEGAGLLSTGLAGNEAGFGEAKTIHEQHLAQINDIIKGAVSVAAAPFTGGASLTGLTSDQGPDLSSMKVPFIGGGNHTTSPDMNSADYADVQNYESDMPQTVS